MPRPGFTFLVCPDSQLIKSRIESLAGEHPPAGGGEYERHVFWAEEGLSPKFWETLTLQSLMARERLVIVRHANKLLAADWKKLSETLSRFLPEAWPVFSLEVAADGKKQPKPPAVLAKLKLWKFAEKKGWTWISKGLDEKSIRSYLADWGRSKGIGFAPGVLDVLQTALPPDASAVERELEKIELGLGDDRTVTRDHLSLVSYSQDLSIFEFINSLQSGRLNAAMWRQALASGGESMLFFFLTMLVREARILWQLALNEEKVVGAPPFALDRKRPVAQRMGPERLAAVWDLALEAELGVKSGEHSPDQAFERLLAGMADLFGGPGRSNQGMR